MLAAQRILVLGSVMVLSPFLAVRAQDAKAPASPPASAQNPDRTQDSSSKTKPKHSNDFLIRGSVFTPEGLSLPGADVRIRRSDEKKFRWNALTNSRGDFAIRVKKGSDYEVLIRMKGLKDETKSVDAKSGGNLEELTVRMEREGGAKQ